MSGKQFFSKHQGSLTVTLFALTVIILVAVFASRLDTFGDVQGDNAASASPPEKAATAQSNPPPATDAPAPESTNEADPQEQAAADEAARQDELRAQLAEASAPMIETASETGPELEEAPSNEDQ